MKTVSRSNINICIKLNTLFFKNWNNTVNIVFFFIFGNKSIPIFTYISWKCIFDSLFQSIPEIWKWFETSTNRSSYSNNLFSFLTESEDSWEDVQIYFDTFLVNSIISDIIRINRTKCAKSNMESDIFFSVREFLKEFSSKMKWCGWCRHRPIMFCKYRLIVFFFCFFVFYIRRKGKFSIFFEKWYKISSFYS